MISRLTMMSTVLAVGLASAASAGIVPVPVTPVSDAVVKVGEGCGPGWWRAADNICRPFASGFGTNRGTPYECPRNWHIGPEGHACWPNR